MGPWGSDRGGVGHMAGITQSREQSMLTNRWYTPALHSHAGLDPRQRLPLPIVVCNTHIALQSRQCHGHLPPRAGLESQESLEFAKLAESCHLSFTPSTRACVSNHFRVTHTESPTPTILQFLKMSPSLPLPSSLLTQVRCPFIDLIITFCTALVPISVLTSLFQKNKNLGNLS